MNMPNIRRIPARRFDSSALGLAVTDFDLRTAARSDACVLLTGREDAARALARRIHNLSGWDHGLTIVDCAWPEEFVRRALFGEFTEPESSSARQPHARLAQAGTVLLQGVWRLGPSAQSRLADWLVSSRGQRVPGWSRCRLMASTSQPLLPRVLDGTFDDRLFYRLNVIHLVIPRGAFAAFPTALQSLRAHASAQPTS